MGKLLVPPLQLDSYHVLHTTWKVCAIAFSQAIARNQQVFDQIWKVKGKV